MALAATVFANSRAMTMACMIVLTQQQARMLGC